MGRVPGREDQLKFDKIGYWSELKLEIIQNYAQAYSKILSKQRLKHVYIDGFSGAGEHISKGAGEVVAGSPLNAVHLDPPLNEQGTVFFSRGRIGTRR